MSAKWILAAVAAVLIGVGVGALSLWREQRAATQETAQVAAQTPQVTEIAIEGVLAATNAVSIPAPIEGILEMVMIDIGSEVYENMMLAQISNTLIETELQMAQEELESAESDVNKAESALISARLEASRARADLTRARDDLDKAQRAAQRQRMLYREGATPKQVLDKTQAEFEEMQTEFDTVESASRQADDRAERARTDLDIATRKRDDLAAEIETINSEFEASQVVSPVTGIITGMAARQGEEVHPGMEALFQVAVDLTAMQIILEPSPAEMEFLRPGQAVQVIVGDPVNATLAGTVTEMSVGRAIVDFANPTPEIRPGLPATVRARR